MGELRILKKTGQPFVRKIEHKFCPKENDWGFSTYLPWSEVVNPNQGYIKKDIVSFEKMILSE